MSHSVFLSFWVLRKKKLFMSPVPAFALSRFSLSLPLCQKMRIQRDGWQMFIGKRRCSLSRFLSFFNSIALNNAWKCVKVATWKGKSEVLRHFSEEERKEINSWAFLTLMHSELWRGQRKKIQHETFDGEFELLGVGCVKKSNFSNLQNGNRAIVLQHDFRLVFNYSK